jgi:hypothetical protein
MRQGPLQWLAQHMWGWHDRQGQHRQWGRNMLHIHRPDNQLEQQLQALLHIQPVNRK